MRFAIRAISSFFLWVAIACSQAYGAENRVALVIGNAGYKSITPLAKPLNDANRVAELLRSIGFVVIFGTDASKSDLQRLANEFRVAAKNADVGFFYYSGHGFQTNRMDQQHPVNHIVPVDFSIGTSDPTLGTLALDHIMTTLKSQARVGFIFMDACRSDPQLAAAAASPAVGTRSVSIARGLSPVSVAVDAPTGRPKGRPTGPSGLLIAYATDPGNVAFEGETGTLSPFTTALVKHIATPGLSASEIMGRVSTDVASETRGQQTPWNVSSLTAGTYQFVPAAKPTQVSGPARPGSAAAGTKGGAGAPARTNLPPNLGGGAGF